MVKEEKIYTTTDGKQYKTKKSAEKHECEIILTEQGYTVAEVNEYIKEISEYNRTVSALSTHKPDWREWNTYLVKQLGELIHKHKNNIVTYKIIKQHYWGRDDETVLKVEHERLEEGKYPKEFDDYLKELEESNTNGSTYKLEPYGLEGSHIKFKLEEVKLTPEEKMAKGIELNEDDISELIWGRNTLYTEEGEDRRWSKSVTSVIEANDGVIYAIDWEKGLTESQPNEFYEQPKKAKLEKREVVTTVTDIIYLDEN